MFTRTEVWQGILAASFFLAATSAFGLEYPMSAVSAPDGAVYVADQYLPGIAVIREGKEEIFFKASTTHRTPLQSVRCVALDADGKLLVGDAATSDVYRFDGDKPTPLTGGEAGVPVSLAVAKTGDIYIADAESHRILKLPAAGGKPALLAEVTAPRGVALDAAGSLWVVTLRENALVKVSPDGKVTPVLKERLFGFPNGLALDDQGTLYVSDGYGAAIWKVTAAGEAKKWVSGAPLVGPCGIQWQKDRLLVADPKAKAIFQVTGDGKISK
ncbi:MAG: NHL repeat-containing protein [Thermoguttaceae bacterium]